jgi:hypothetical protein
VHTSVTAVALPDIRTVAVVVVVVVVRLVCGSSRCSPEGNCQPWNKTEFTKTDEEWDSCEDALAHICPGMRGHGFKGCMDCVDTNRPAVVKACGNFTDKDMMHPGMTPHHMLLGHQPAQWCVHRWAGGRWVLVVAGGRWV